MVEHRAGRLEAKLDIRGGTLREILESASLDARLTGGRLALRRHALPMAELQADEVTATSGPASRSPRASGRPRRRRTGHARHLDRHAAAARRTRRARAVHARGARRGYDARSRRHRGSAARPRRRGDDRDVGRTPRQPEQADRCRPACLRTVEPARPGADHAARPFGHATHRDGGHQYVARPGRPRPRGQTAAGRCAPVVAAVTAGRFSAGRAPAPSQRRVASGRAARLGARRGRRHAGTARPRLPAPLRRYAAPGRRSRARRAPDARRRPPACHARRGSSQHRLAAHQHAGRLRRGAGRLRCPRRRDRHGGGGARGPVRLRGARRALFREQGRGRSDQRRHRPACQRTVRRGLPGQGERPHRFRAVADRSWQRRAGPLVDQRLPHPVAVPRPQRPVHGELLRRHPRLQRRRGGKGTPGHRHHPRPRRSAPAARRLPPRKSRSASRRAPRASRSSACRRRCG